jgi:hypothetical protein
MKMMSNSVEGRLKTRPRRPSGVGVALVSGRTARAVEAAGTGLISAAVLLVVAGILVPTTVHAQAASPAAAAAPTVESILSKHYAARGGEEAWKQVRSLRAAGSWEAFSTEMPATVQWMRPGHYRFDVKLFGGEATLATDGQKAWMQGAGLGVPDGAEAPPGWSDNILADAVFGPPLMARAARGDGIELLGREKVEDLETWKLKVTLSDGREEIWFLDAATFLEVKAVGKIFDVFSGPGIQLEVETYFMGFTPVEDVIIPFRVENHFGTRYQVHQAESVEVNPALDEAIFKQPPAPPAEEDAKAAEGGQ